MPKLHLFHKKAPSFFWKSTDLLKAYQILLDTTGKVSKKLGYGICLQSSLKDMLSTSQSKTLNNVDYLHIRLYNERAKANQIKEGFYYGKNNTR